MFLKFWQNTFCSADTLDRKFCSILLLETFPQAVCLLSLTFCFTEKFTSHGLISPSWTQTHKASKSCFSHFFSSLAIFSSHIMRLLQQLSLPLLEETKWLHILFPFLSHFRWDPILPTNIILRVVVTKKLQKCSTV